MSCFRRKSSVVHEQFGDETVIVNLDNGCYYSARGAGNAIWANLMASLSLADTAQRMVWEYEGDAAIIGNQTAEFVGQLLDENLIEEVTDQAAPPAPTSGGNAGKAWVAPTMEKYTDMEEMLQLDPIHEVDEMGWPQAKRADN